MVAFKLVHVTTAPESLYYFLDGQARFMAEQGAEVYGVSSPGDWLDLFAEREGAKTYDVEMPRSLSPLRDMVALWRLYRFFRRVRPAIVHTHTLKGGLYGLLAALLARVPVRIYHIHGSLQVTATGWKRRVFRLAEKMPCLLAHQVFCVSESIMNLVCKEGICSSAKARVLADGSINGVDAQGRFDPSRHEGAAVRDFLGIPGNARVIGFVGRLVGDKGILDLLQFWGVLREKYRDAHLLLVGSFEVRDALPDTVKQNLLADNRIHLTGHVENPAPYYAAMDVFAFPSHREGFGLVAIEAAAMKVPVVAYRIPGCIDSVADQETGCLVDGGNAGAFTEAVSLYLTNPSLRREHGLAGRERVLRDFQPARIWDALYREYVRQMKKHGVVMPEIKLHDGAAE